MPRFNTINVYQNRSKIKLFFAQKIQNFRALGAPSLDPRNRIGVARRGPREPGPSN